MLPQSVSTLNGGKRARVQHVMSLYPDLHLNERQDTDIHTYPLLRLYINYIVYIKLAILKLCNNLNYVFELRTVYVKHNKSTSLNCQSEF